MKRYFLWVLFFALPCTISLAQDDLLKQLEAEPIPVEPVTATFKGTRLINLHTVETLTKGSLDFRISHRFGEVGGGAGSLWGLDGPATLRLGLDYSLTNKLILGLGRTNYQKTFDGFVKYKILAQTPTKMPVSVVAISSINYRTDEDPLTPITGIDRYDKSYRRISYMTQILIARKFNEKLSLQLAPTFIHFNIVDQFRDKNDLVALAGSGRFKLTKRLALTSEYIFRVTNYGPAYDNHVNVVSLGLDIETGGHVFQLFFTNAAAINEVQLIPYTVGSWQDKAVRFGFNISRVFDLRKEKSTTTW